jgi:hypothetical protein
MPVLASLRLERSGREESARGVSSAESCNPCRGRYLIYALRPRGRCAPRANGFNASGVRGPRQGRKQRGSFAPLGLGFHVGMEPSAHALGYRLSALRAWGHGFGGREAAEVYWDRTRFFFLSVRYRCRCRYRSRRVRRRVAGRALRPRWACRVGRFRMLQALRGCFRFPREPGVRFATPGYPLRSLRDRGASRSVFFGIEPDPEQDPSGNRPARHSGE